MIETPLAGDALWLIVNKGAVDTQLSAAWHNRVVSHSIQSKSNHACVHLPEVTIPEGLGKRLLDLYHGMEVESSGGRDQIQRFQVRRYVNWQKRIWMNHNYSNSEKLTLTRNSLMFLVAKILAEGGSHTSPRWAEGCACKRHALPKICLTGRRSAELHIEAGGLSALLATDDVNPELCLGQFRGGRCHNSCQVWICCRALKHLSNRTKEHLPQ